MTLEREFLHIHSQVCVCVCVCVSTYKLHPSSSTKPFLLSRILLQTLKTTYISPVCVYKVSKDRLFILPSNPHSHQNPHFI